MGGLTRFLTCNVICSGLQLRQPPAPTYPRSLSSRNRETSPLNKMAASDLSHSDATNRILNPPEPNSTHDRLVLYLKNEYVRVYDALPEDKKGKKMYVGDMVSQITDDFMRSQFKVNVFRPIIQKKIEIKVATKKSYLWTKIFTALGAAPKERGKPPPKRSQRARKFLPKGSIGHSHISITMLTKFIVGCVIIWPQRTMEKKCTRENGG